VRHIFYKHEKRSVVTLDALILAGNRKDYIPVGNGNKALLEVGGRPVIEYVIEALEAAALIDGIYIVGPVEELSFLRNRHPDIVLIGQQDTLADNVLSSYEMICPEHDRHILVTTSDIPFIRPSEIDAFIDSSGYNSYDIVLGIAGEAVLSRFFPSGDRPGIKNNCCYLRQGPVRLNNLFIMRHPPDALIGYASTIYRVRYQKKLRNFLRLMTDVLIRNPGMLRLFWTLLIMQATLQADRLALYGAARAMGSLLDIKDAENTASRAIGARFKTMMMDHGGAAMDIDNEESLKAVRIRFEEFMRISNKGPASKHP
jgi:molybdopterin-guanine dinucleotide biosynthesis protein A